MKAIAWTATLFCLSYMSVPNVAAGSNDCPPLLIPGSLYASSGVELQSTQPPEFQLRKGRLRPQLEKLLRQHLAVQHITWQASEAHEWPSDYKLQAPTWDLLLGRLASPYQLRIQLFANHTAVVDYLPHVKGVL